MVKWKELTEEHVTSLKKKMKEKLDEMNGEDPFAFLCDQCWEAYKEQVEPLIREAFKAKEDLIKLVANNRILPLKTYDELKEKAEKWDDLQELKGIRGKFFGRIEELYQAEKHLEAVKTLLKEVPWAVKSDMGAYQWFLDLCAAAEG